MDVEESPNSHPNQFLVSFSDQEIKNSTIVLHDYKAALRALTYLADKAASDYKSSNDPLADAKIASIGKHLETLKSTQKNIVDPFLTMLLSKKSFQE